MKIIRALISVFVLSITANATQTNDTSWKEYINERFGYSLHVPNVLIASRDPVNGSGREYHTTNKEFSVASGAHFLRIADPNESLESHWNEDLAECKNQITYKKKSDSWYVISGVTTNGYFFYNKFFTKGNNWATFHITYLKLRKSQYDPWVLRIEKNFKPFLPGKQYDRAEWKGSLVK